MTDDCKECGKPMPDAEKNEKVDQLADDILNGNLPKDVDMILEKLKEIMNES